ncbi:hypothetical protein LENED_005914 [Lentinula edodes]|uniref:Ubiquitin-like domain-containing protein n=1 Tax=Lentinula edodes TaxID=5353 RepID=A0A1Q3EAM1_LENED|nr:hypothetical protein LENED_005914 [Lentinula edodes]
MSDEHQPALPTIPILVELPAYGYSFTVHLPSEPTSTSAASSNTVLSIKHAISRTCPGNPQVDGQRVIWRGRVLGDAEKVGELWPVVDGYGGQGLKRIVHLSVHPSAWTGKPPVISAAREVRESKEVGSEKGKGKEKEIVAERDDVVNKLRAAAAVTFESSTTTSKSAPTVTTAPPPPALPAYLISTHRQALSALTDLEGFTPEAFTSSDNEREIAIRFVNAHGYSWPATLDEGYPSTDVNSEKGVRYVKDVIDGRPYLRLLNPTETPTAAQKHALKVLSFTFELLKLPTQPSRHTSSPSIPNTAAQPNQPGVPVPETTPAVQVPAHLNAVLQQMGLPPITENLPPGVVNVIQQPQQQVPQAQGGVQFDLNQFFNANNLNNNDNNNNNNHQIQQINIRPILLPLLMLSLRMFLLLYFVAPARKPFLMLLVLAWVGWEIWGWIAALGVRVEVEIERGRMEGGGAGERPPGGGGAPQPAPPPAQQNVAAQAPPAVPAANNPPAPAPAPAAPPTLLDNLASFGIAQDQAALESTLPLETDSPEPGFARKVLLFLVLFLISVHPAVWNRRRALLRAREGQVRVEMGVLAEGVGEQESGAADDASALETTRRAQRRAEMYVKYMSRPAWVRRYMQRVMSAQAGEGAWVDEAD